MKKKQKREVEREEFNNFGRADEFSSLELFGWMDRISKTKNAAGNNRILETMVNEGRGRNVCHGYWVVSERRDKTTTKTTKLSFHSKKKKKRKKKKKKKNRRDQEEKQIK